MGARRSRVTSGTVLVLGGRSEIGLEVARRLAPGRVICLAARRSDDLAEESVAVASAGATAVHTVEFDADDLTSHQALLDRLFADHGPIGVVVLAFGILGDQARAEREPSHALEVIQTDFVAHVNVLTIVSNLLRAQGSGQIVAFSSIAGARVRRANYVYGSAKAGLDGFATGLSDALRGSGVDLLVVRPGFVIGRMTEGMTAVPLFSSTPDHVASAVVKALETGKTQVWIPPALALAAAVMRLIPPRLWRRMPR